ncbi:hypothetical protein ERY13_23510 [Paenibacillus mucilaginosus]|uniref:hypothetical protein n=1 Tax=Paenibacillus mucilaginosus TaxID=61624 RepID=UPI00059FBB24|nr:hypothetical protein [Paenibacillus mucilaginosus]WFA19991.1 hypothetical protein ERY13_23510 [Paenibacillus mucilaginosus]
MHFQLQSVIVFRPFVGAPKDLAFVVLVVPVRLVVLVVLVTLVKPGKAGMLVESVMLVKSACL